MIATDQVGLRSQERPSDLAVAGPAGALSYAELWRRSGLLATALHEAGVGPGTPVGILLPRTVDLVVGALGVMRAGGAYLALDGTYPPARLGLMLGDCAAPILLTGANSPQLSPPPGCQAFDLEEAEGRGSAGDLDRLLPQPSSGDLAYVVYTSGSTGQPKAVGVTHGNLANLVGWHRRAFQITSEDRASQLASPAFDAAVWEIWPYLASGASVHLAPDGVRSDPQGLRDWLVGAGITVAFAPTPMAEMLIETAWPREGTLRTLLTGGDLLHHFPKPGVPFTLVNNYGPAEATVVATSGVVPGRLAAEVLPSIGQAIDGVSLRIVDEDLRSVSQGVPGELLIGGAGIARGYLGQPELTASRFIDDPQERRVGGRLYRTGDLVWQGPEGDLHFLGRLDDQVKVRGQRLELGEVEAVLNRHATVAATTVKLTGEYPASQLVAYVVTTDREMDREALREHLALTLPDYMIPSDFVAVERLPLTANGKVDRAALPTPTLGAADPGTMPPAGISEVEEALATIVAELLGRNSVGCDENFFMLGGHSLLGAQLIARINTAYGVELPLRCVFDGPTVTEMASAVERLLLEEISALSDGAAERLMAGDVESVPAPLSAGG